MSISNRPAAYPPLDPNAVLWSTRPPAAGTDLLIMMHGWSYDERHLFALRWPYIAESVPDAPALLTASWGAILTS
jgi:hypothetical protein